MQNVSRLGGLALAASLGALGLAGYVLLDRRPDTRDLEARLAAVEARLEAEGGLVRTRPDASAPAPLLRGTPDGAEAPALRDGTAAASGSSSGRGPAGPGGEAPGVVAAEDGESAQKIRQLVDEAVAKKATQLAAMRDKKPTIETFAGTLALTEEQRLLAERQILQSQHEIRQLLETRAQDGTSFLDELVEVMAEGMASPGKASPRAMKLFGRLLTENVPGTGETYAARAEAVKARLRESFRREWTKEQYAAFEAWQMDPTEVRDIEGSPWKDLEPRVLERAKDLGAEVPAKAPR